MDRKEIEARIDELEMSLQGDATDDDTRGDILEEIADLEAQLSGLEEN